MSTLINLTDLQAELAGDHPPLVAEVLPPAHHRSGHLPGAVNLPLDGFETNASLVAPDRQRAVVVYCSGPTCGNSHLAARKLVALGYESVRVFSGGKSEWQDAGLVLEVAP